MTKQGYLPTEVTLRPTYFPYRVEVVMKRDPTLYWVKGKVKSIIQPKPKYEGKLKLFQPANIEDTLNYIYGHVSFINHDPPNNGNSVPSGFGSYTSIPGLFSTVDLNGNFKIIVPDSLLNRKVKFTFVWSKYLRRFATIHLNRFPIRLDIVVNLSKEPDYASLKPSFFSLLFSNAKPGKERNYIYGKFMRGDNPGIGYGFVIHDEKSPGIGAITDDNGNYKILIPDSLLNKKVTLLYCRPEPSLGNYQCPLRIISLTHFPKKININHPENRGFHQ